MIIRPRPTAFGLWFILRGSIVPEIASRLLAVLGISILAVWLHQLAPAYFHDINPAPFTLLGLALSIFLGFRNNICYERWWEGRKQWGELVAVSRDLLREAVTLLPGGTRQRVARRTVAFAHALRGQLRDEPQESARPWLAPGEWEALPRGRSRAAAILGAQAADLNEVRRQGALGDILYRAFADHLAAMSAVQAACERLRTTPPPFAYSLLLHRTAWLFCLLLPFGMVDNLGLATPLLTMILAYAFFGLDALGEQLEEPFSLSPNGLPLDALVRNIEIAAGEALGDATLPAPLLPEQFLLL
ncbi:membrane protein [Acidocella aquatica]|uniref:Membrane protein n=1 Tax=Acidocella aquatica TaxID=1922313 RepID=A0ABQ6A9X3_9PROT|nr:bestrophin family protein [Acidocella aquatica]GLR68363.1 membrane protein [Acidocella aquatica]